MSDAAVVRGGDPAGVRALWRAKQSGPPVRRDDAGDARRVLEAMLADPGPRRAAVELLTLAIEEANQAPRSWSLTLHPRCIRMNVGLVLLLDILPETIVLAGRPDDAARLPGHTFSEQPFSSVDGPHGLVAIPASRLQQALPALREILPRSVAMALTSARHSLHRRAWSPGVLDMIQDLTGRPLPRPDWETEMPEPAEQEDSFIDSEVEALGQLVRSPTHQLETILSWRSAFHDRFGPDRLLGLSGLDLLEHMHGRSDQNSLVYWLEFKNDDAFNARAFGSIAGGSALKFGFFQRARDAAWISGSARDMHELTVEQAVDKAESQRDELMAAWEVIDALPDDLDDQVWLAMPDAVMSAAPTWGHLAFFHKVLALWEPTKISDYHSLPYTQHALARLGVHLPSPNLWTTSMPFIRLGERLRGESSSAPDLQLVTSACNRRYGSPHGHWRVGTTEGDQDRWPPMRDGDHVGIGWDELGDLDDLVGGMKSRQARTVIRERLIELWPSTDRRVAGIKASEIWKFYAKMQEEDLVYAAKGLQVRGVGRIAGEYRYDPDASHFKHRRSVRWMTKTAFTSPSRKGLLTTVKDLSTAHDIQAAAWRQVATAPSETRVEAIRSSGSRALGPIEAQLERKGQVLLFGPPGTGKTYNALRAARAIAAHDAFGKSWAALSDAQRARLERGDADRRIWMCTFHPAFSYEDFVEGLKPVAREGQLSFEPRPGLFRRLCAAARAHKEHRFVLIIDEFNRGDAPRIFGELLTLLELDKRDSVSVTLPTSGEAFAVPHNVRIIATMNTSDRSIAHLDAALRRRFGFLEFLPDPSVVEGLSVDGLPMAGLMDRLNERLVDVLGPRARNLQIGHSYFMGCRSIRALRSALQYDILPLVQEYCADDPALLDRLLGRELYDRDRQRIRDSLFQPGAEDALKGAIQELGDFDMEAPVLDPDDEDGEDDEGMEQEGGIDEQPA